VAEDYYFVLDSEADVLRARPDMQALSKFDLRGVCITAKADEGFDFVSRFFAPKFGINEDPVTGSTHTVLAPYWSKKLHKNELSARQLSKRGGTIHCSLHEDRVILRGKAVKFLEGEIILG
jgi:predicted PhzF superfamily epimerase YddE/YHI9